MVAVSGDKPYRIHTRGPSFANLAALNTMAQGHKIADLVHHGKSRSGDSGGRQVTYEFFNFHSFRDASDR